MPLMAGSLDGWLRAFGPNRHPDPKRVALIVRDVARGVHYAHQHGLIHRDLKPLNVLLDDGGTPKIALGSTNRSQFLPLGLGVLCLVPVVTRWPEAAPSCTGPRSPRSCGCGPRSMATSTAARDGVPAARDRRKRLAGRAPSG